MIHVEYTRTTAEGGTSSEGGFTGGGEAALAEFAQLLGTLDPGESLTFTATRDAGDVPVFEGGLEPVIVHPAPGTGAPVEDVTAF